MIIKALATLFGILLIALIVWRRQRVIDRPLSESWRVDAARRRWGVGIDQACVREWPITKDEEKPSSDRGDGDRWRAR